MNALCMLLLAPVVIGLLITYGKRVYKKLRFFRLFRALARNKAWVMKNTSALFCTKSLRSENSRNKKALARQMEKIPDSTRSELYKQTLFQKHALSEGHQKELEKRGLSSSVVRSVNIRTVDHDTKFLVPEEAKRLPGLQLEDKPTYDWFFRARYVGTVCTKAGILIPAYTPEGLLVGAQVKVDKPWLDSSGKPKGKYIWLSSRCVGGSPAYLENGDPPLFYWYNWTIKYKLLPFFSVAVRSEAKNHLPQCSQVIGLCEGALKSCIASQRFCMPFIAPGGCDFVASKRTLLSYLSQLTKNNKNTSLLVLFPDSGAVQNKHVSLANLDTIQFLLKHKYHVRIAWWYQVEKGQDVDEISAETAQTIELLNAKQFFECHSAEIQRHILKKLPVLQEIFDVRANK